MMRRRSADLLARRRCSRVALPFRHPIGSGPLNHLMMRRRSADRLSRRRYSRVFDLGASAAACSLAVVGVAAISTRSASIFARRQGSITPPSTGLPLGPAFSAAAAATTARSCSSSCLTRPRALAQGHPLVKPHCEASFVKPHCEVHDECLGGGWETLSALEAPPEQRLAAIECLCDATLFGNSI